MSFGGFSSRSEQSQALNDAILQARQQNPGLFQNVASNYLLGKSRTGTYTPTESLLSQIGQTGTFNIRTASGVATVGSDLIARPFGTQYYNSGTAQNPSIFIGDPSLIANLSRQANPNSDTSNSRNISQAFGAGLNQITGFFQQHPLGLLAIAGLAAFVVLRK